MTIPILIQLSYAIDLSRKVAQMKLVVAIVQDEDADNLVNEIVGANFRVTRVSSTGSLLRTGNTSLIVGVEDHGGRDVWRL